MPPASATSSIQGFTPEPVQFVLKPISGSCDRVIIITDGIICEVGRASQSSTRTLAPAPDNALFDCPVMSRKHAEFSVEGWSTCESEYRIFITDLESMHGTQVNGRKLTPHQRHLLNHGDVIKFGDAVKRGQDSHDGVTLVFRTCEPETPVRGEVWTTRGYFFTSDSEHSELYSDSESVISLVEQPTSSAQTTPEKAHMVPLGSQQKPIDLEASLSRRNQSVIDLSGSDDEGIKSRPIKKTVVADTYDIDDDIAACTTHRAPTCSPSNGAESIHEQVTGLTQFLIAPSPVLSAVEKPDDKSLADQAADQADTYNAYNTSGVGANDDDDNEGNSLSGSDVSELEEVDKDLEDALEVEDIEDDVETGIQFRAMSPELGAEDLSSSAVHGTSSKAAIDTDTDSAALLYDPACDSQASPTRSMEYLNFQIQALKKADLDERSGSPSGQASAETFFSDSGSAKAPVGSASAPFPPLQSFYGGSGHSVCLRGSYGVVCAPSSPCDICGSSIYATTPEVVKPTKTKISIDDLVEHPTVGDHVAQQNPGAEIKTPFIMKRKAEHMENDGFGNEALSPIAHDAIKHVESTNVPRSSTPTTLGYTATSAAGNNEDSPRVKRVRTNRPSTRSSNSRSRRALRAGSVKRAGRHLFRLGLHAARFGVVAAKYSTAAAFGGAAMFVFLASSHSDRLLEYVS